MFARSLIKRSTLSHQAVKANCTAGMNQVGVAFVSKG